MKNKPKKQRPSHYSFIIVPHNDEGRMISFKMPSKVIHNSFLALFLVIALFVGLIGYNSYVTAKAANYKIAKIQSDNKAKRIGQYGKDAEDLKVAVMEMHLRNNQLRKLLGMKLESPGEKIKKVVDYKLLKQLNEKEKTIYQALDETKRIAQKDQESLKKLKAHVTKSYKEMSKLPSKWPIHGKIVSRYGYRTDPWKGFHSGIDIKARYGYPIRSTAPGVVKFVGWRKGYGKMVEIQHQFGYSTRYAHCSRLLVSRGDEIKAGQIIAKVGTTGYSTGAHLHYEVRKNNQHINPFAFLDLKILTAAKLLK